MCDLYGSVGVQTHRLKSSTKDRPKTTIEQQQQRRVHWLNIRAMVIRDGAPMHTSDCRWSYTLLSSNACFNHSPAQPSTTINSVVAERSPAAVLTHLPRRRSSRIASYSQVYTEVPSACKSACKLPPSSKKTINKKQKRNLFMLTKVVTAGSTAIRAAIETMTIASQYGIPALTWTYLREGGSP